jgi:hypothetical protein
VKYGVLSLIPFIFLQPVYRPKNTRTSIKLSVRHDSGWIGYFGGPGLYWVPFNFGRVNQWSQYTNLKLFWGFFIMWFVVLLYVFVYYLNNLWALSATLKDVELFISFKFSSSIGTATLVGYDLLNYRWVLSAGRFLQIAVSSGTSNPQLGGLVIRTFQLPPLGVPHVWNDASEPQQRKVEIWAKNFREFCRKLRLPRHFWGWNSYT